MLWWRNFLSWGTSSKMAPACAKLTKLNNITDIWETVTSHINGSPLFLSQPPFILRQVIIKLLIWSWNLWAFSFSLPSRWGYRNMPLGPAHTFLAPGQLWAPCPTVSPSTSGRYMKSLTCCGPPLATATRTGMSTCLRPDPWLLF